MTNTKPILAVTMGDPAGIGPEIALKAFADSKVYKICNPVLAGSREEMTRAVHLIGPKVKINCISTISEAKFRPGTIDLMDIGNATAKIEFGKISPEAGRLAFLSVKKAIELAMKREVDGTVTNPIHKKAINEAGFAFSGHTEIYAHYTGTAKYAMLLADDKIRVIHVSTHVSLREACDLVKKKRIIEVIEILSEGLQKLGFLHPRIGVAGLNPHAGDDGLFGQEEISEIIPAVNEARLKGYNVSGPFPPDTLFALAAGGAFDGCVAMYHDQGHIPFKMSGFQWDEKNKTMKSVKGVNITLGLPIVRTSVDHGTAFEIAGKGVASPEALINAVEYAVKLSKTQHKQLIKE